MSPIGDDLRFDSVLSRRSTEKRAIFFVVPGVIALFALVAFAAAAISRQSGLETRLRTAQQQVQEANKVVEERDRQLREAHAETAVLASAGQGAGVLNAVSKESPASGVVLDHPAQHALAVYAFNLAPAPAGQEYRLIVTDGTGQESLLGTLRPDDRGGSFLMDRDVPEGIAKVEVALVPKAAPGGGAPAAKGGAGDAPREPQRAGGQAPTQRQPILIGALPRPGEAGVVLAASAGEGEPQAKGKATRAGRRGR